MERAVDSDAPMRVGNALHVSDNEETPAAAEARRAAGASNVDSAANPDGIAANDNDDDELDDFALSSGDEGDAAGGKEPALDRAMMNELLLVCSNLGMLRVQREGDEPVLMRGEDCEEWIHDLQRAIRRDHAKYKLVAKQLGKWKILQKKLLPLLLNHQHDWSLVFSILKVLVMLTMKPSKESTNVAQQLTYLRAYKCAFLRHDVVPMLMTILVDPLSRKGSARTAQDYLNMELVLTLVRNVLAIPNEDPRFVTSTTTYLSHLQQDFIQTLHNESAYEMLLLFAQDIESAENREWNLLIMEMLDLTLACSHPKAVAAFAKQQQQQQLSHDTNDGTSVASTAKAKPKPAVSLTQTLNSEKLSAHKPVGSRRHSNFGGVLTLVGPTGRSTLLTNFAKVADDQVPQVAKKPIARRRGGRQRAGPAADLSEIFSASAKVTESDSETMRVLVSICDALLAKSYFQLTNSLKNEFRRGSSKLVATDRLEYFHLVWFLTTYHRLTLEAQRAQHRQNVRAHAKQTAALLEALDFATPAPPAPVAPALDEKAVLSTLDMFSFNFVLQSIETYASVRNVHGMTVSVQLLTEMMAYLTALHSSDDPRYQRIADSLQHKILYERDFLDRLPVLLKTWTPGTFSRDYVADVVTLTHLVFKMLDAQGNIKVLSRRKALLESKKKKTPKKRKTDDDNGDNDDASEDSDDNEEEEAERQAQLLLEMQRKEADFDVRRYFQSLLSPDTIKMYCFLLSTYRDNSARVNHYIHAFLYRAKHFRVVPHEDWTMQPLLFNIHVLALFHRMLQDTSIQTRSDLRGLLDFIRGVVRDYFALAATNHLLFVESLLRQPYAAKAALLLQRNYEPLDAMTKSRSEAVALGREQQLARLNEVRRHKRAIDAEELEGEEEFEFTLAPADFTASALTAKTTSREDGAESDGGAEFSGLAQQQPALEATTTKKKRTATSRAGSERAKTWTKVEDRYLAKMYRMYRHLPSVYEVISYEDMFQDRDRTAEQIERRVKFLKLHRKTHDSSDEDDDDNVDASRDGAKTRSDDDDDDVDLDAAMDVAPRESTRPRRRLRRVAALSDDDGSNSEDDLLQLLGGRKPRASGSHSPDTAATSLEGGVAAYEHATDTHEPADAAVLGGDDTATLVLDAVDAATQGIADNDAGDTEMIDDEHDGDVPVAQTVSRDGEDEATLQTAAATASASAHVELSPTTTTTTTTTTQADDVVVETAATPQKRARSTSDGENPDVTAADAGADVADRSPLKKVARSTDAQDDSAADAANDD